MDKQASSLRNSSEARALAKSEHRGLDAGALACLGDLTVLAARACEAQFALISLSVGGVCRVVSKTGWSTHDQDPFGDYVMRSSSEVFVVPDALVDDRFTQGTLAAAVAKHKVRFYAGVAVRGSSGRVLGTFGGMDNKQRELTSAHAEALQALAREAASQGAERIRLTIQALRRLSHGNEESISDFQIRYTLAGPSRED